MNSDQQLANSIGATIDSVKAAVQNLEIAAPLLGQRHSLFQGEVTRLIATLQRIESDVIDLLDAGDVDPEFEALMTPHAQVTTCAICGNTIQPREPNVPTAAGDVVHIACADWLAARAQVRRRRWALAHAVIFIGGVLTIASFIGITPWLLAFTIAGIVLHSIMHRRWWYYLRRDLGTWLLLGARK